MAKPTDGKANREAPVRNAPAKRRPPRAKSPPESQATWSPPEEAVWVERHPDGRVTMLHHPAHPFPGRWDPASPNIDGLTPIADRYLAAVNQFLTEGRKEGESEAAVAELWLRDLEDDPHVSVKDRFTLRWLRGAKDARHTRRTTEAQTVVLLGGIALPSGGSAHEPLYGGQGLRIVAHVDAPKDGKDNVRIVGMTSTLPLWSGKPKDAKQAWYPENGIAFDLSALAGLGKRIVDAFGLAPPRASARSRTDAARTGAKVASQGLFVPDAPPVTPRARTSTGAFYGIAMTAPLGSAERVSYRLVTRFDASRKDAEDTGGEPLYREPMVAGIDATALVLKQEPVSQNGAAERIQRLPSKSWTVLDRGRTTVKFPGLSAGGVPGTVKLADPSGNFVVTRSRLVTEDNGLPEDDPKEVAGSDDRACPDRRVRRRECLLPHRPSCSVGWRGMAWIRRPTSSSRIARSGALPRGDLSGRTRRPDDQRAGLVDPQAAARGRCRRVTLEMRFALGDLMNSVELSPLGIAADPRWCWHEFSHVLLMAATGQREFAFAHSAGDALAAIVCDAESKLALDGTDTR